MSEPLNDNGAGYCKPPKHTQFVRGTSGNPRGRPKGSHNITTLLIREGKKKVQIKTNGQVRTVTKLEAGIMQLFNKAASGDMKALQQALYWQRTAEESANVTPSQPILGESDKAVMLSLLKRLRNSGQTEITDPQQMKEGEE